MIPRWAAWTAAVALLAVAGVVRAGTPDTDARLAPFVVTAAQGEQGTGRNLAVTVTFAARADRVTADDFSADGNWLVVELDAATVVEETSSGLGLVTFEIGGRTFSASERFTSLRADWLANGLPRRGLVAFELPADVQGGVGILSFALNGDPRLDSVIEVPLDLGAAPRTDVVEITPTDWASP